VRLLHAIHDFLPRHRAGSEIYAAALARELARRHDVFVVTAEYDPATPHGTIRWRRYDGLPVIEIVNNWEFGGFEETYSSPRLNAQLGHVLDATRPDVLHVHNLLNLSFDLPRLARARGAATVATLHDYTLLCASGGQRVHAAEAHVCRRIEPDRCARCFTGSPWQRQMAAGQVTRRRGGGLAGRAAAAAARVWPRAAQAVAGRLSVPATTPGDISRRLAYARHVFEAIDLFVAPSAALADEFVALGLSRQRLRVSDYGFAPAGRQGRHPDNHRRRTRDPGRGGALRIGFVGTPVWHKGVHVLLEAARGLTGAFSVNVHGDLSVFPDYASALRRLAAGLPVTFHGGFDAGRLGDVYGAMDVLVVPSLWPENSPLVIHEAFQHGIGVVGARTGGIPGLISPGVNGALYEPYSPDQLRSRLQALVDDPATAATWGEHVPAVKSIEADAREWEVRYAEVTDLFLR
jgi:glycosyltransferase involved in cell wall biosynthesis